VIDPSQGSAAHLAMPVHILVLNYNGRQLLAECLPSIVQAAGSSRHPCEVAVIDNDSDDDSVAWLARYHPQIRVIHHANRGLCSFNDVLAELPGSVAVLLNNDIKLDPGAIDPLVEPLLESDSTADSTADSACFMTAPLCWLFDGQTYEGFKTAVRWRWGLVQATALFEGHQPVIRAEGLTASAGAAIAVDKHKFLELGGFDPIYLPGRIEDLDFAFRGYAAGYHALYVPRSVAYHRGMSTFGRVFGSAGCDRLALRNTLLFQWKNLHDIRSILQQMVGLPIRAMADLVRLPWAEPSRRLAFIKAFIAAMARLRQLRAAPSASKNRRCRARLFFKEFHPRQVIRRDLSPAPLMEACR
jgi:GT2 family glycosyltransferase